METKESEDGLTIQEENTVSVEVLGIEKEVTINQNVIKEGKAEIRVPGMKNVFYNPVQEFNRDISVAVLSLFAEDNFSKCRNKRSRTGDVKQYVQNGESTEELKPGVYYEEGISILEALSATGLRSVRFAKEVPGVKSIIANDISKAAVESIDENLESNSVKHLVSTENADASLLMYRKKSENIFFDVIDLDPYGCPSKFLDAAVQSVSDGGLLMVTCTDMAVLCGNTPETCHYKYGAISLRSSACHEMALRIALKCIESHANLYGRYITPLLSFSVDFYIRLVVRINSSPVTCKKTLSKLSHIYRCVGCKSFMLHPLGLATPVNNKQLKFTLPHAPKNNQCPHCNFNFQIGGPIWNGPLHEPGFVSKLMGRVSKEEDRFATSRRMVGLLSVIYDELNESPLYYTIESLCSAVHCSIIPLVQFRSALLNAGYQVSLSHAAPNSIKTTAGAEVLWDIVRAWVKTKPVSVKRLTEGSVAAYILGKDPVLAVDFTLHPRANLKSDLLRYQVNPLPNWGPGTRSHTRVGDEENISKKHQNSKKRKKEPGEQIVETTK